MAMVFAADGLEANEKLLLLAYTNFTDPHGYCWPGEDRLAACTGMSASTVRRTKKKLIDKNLLKSKRRAETSNLARVNLPLLASMARPEKTFDDNEMERLSFDGAASKTGSDLRTGQPDLSPSQAADLRTVQSDLMDRSDCSVGQVNLTSPMGQSDLESISDPSEVTISRPSFPDAGDDTAADGQTEGGTDGMRVPQQISRNPGVDLLLAIGYEKPEFLLTGKTLHDQGLQVAGMLMEGWTPQQLRHVIAGRPLPDPIRTSVGAIVASRLGQALSGPTPERVLGSVKLMEEEGLPPQQKPTPAPASWNADMDLPGPVSDECVGKDGMCGRPTVPGSSLCWHCAPADANL
ncbi:helix-turn-helix domain-containing protein [Streptomyces chilikensis]|uniref:Helix-turn-helix domain-containing protein n=1 Tax=Streptomyces chilikensis TaxID=1194079 RepID=A0ABV3ERQ8_9ACTN